MIYSTRFIFIICFSLFDLYTQAQSNWRTSLNQYRDSVNGSFANAETSILSEEDLKTFVALEFYMPDSEFVITASVKLLKKKKWFEMKTTTERKPVYRPYANLSFEYKGAKYSLTCYQSEQLMNNPEYRDYLFLPFTDLSSGNESYGGGRYLDLRIGDIQEGKVILDFNYAYNPYCAYNHKYSCPIPPADNFLDADIEAGAKAYPAD